MAETFVTLYQGAGGRVDIGYEYTQDIANNKTSLTVKAYAMKTNSSYYSYRSSPQTFTLTVNGIATTYGWTFNFSNMTLNARYLITTATRELTHNSDGTVAGIGASVYCATGTEGLGTISGNTTISIPTIPRTSIATVNTTTQAIGSAITIYTNRNSASFTHTINYYFGNLAINIVNGVTDSYVWTLPTDLAGQIPTSMSGSGYLKIITYSGSTYIGEVNIGFTATIPDNASYYPTAWGLSVSISGSGRDKTISKYVQNISKVDMSFQSSANNNGSYISSNSISISKAGNNAMYINGTSGTTGILTLSGTYTVTATTTDSRGKSFSLTYNITVEPYSVPTITSFTAVRQASTKTNVDTVRSGVYTHMGGSNTLSVVVSRAPRGGAFTALNTTSGASGSFSGTYVSTGNTDTASYDFKLVITDSFGNSATGTITVSTASIALCIKGDVGIGVGKVWEQGALDVGGDAYVSKNIMSRGLAIATERITYEYSSGILIDLGSSALQWTMFTVEISGNGYGSGVPVNTIIQFYHYNPIGTFINQAQLNMGANLPSAKVFLDGGRIKCWIAQGASYQTSKIRAYTNGGMLNDITISNSSEPTGTNKITCPIINTWNTNNFNPASYSTTGHTHSQYIGVGQGIEVSSSNANGRYIKYGDGTMICWGVAIGNSTAINNPWGSSYYGTYVTYTFPVAFVGVPAVMAQNTNAYGEGLFTVSSSTASNFTGYVIRPSVGAYGVYNTYYMAIGRWW